MSSRYLEHRPSRQIPEYLRKFINLRGGMNPFNEPRYRLVWSEDRFEQVGGEWYEWDESLSVNDRNYVNRHGQELNKPRRVVEDLRWIHKYPTEHKWVLEKWQSAETYGDPELWYQAVSPSGKVPLMGAYPHQGDYESTGYEFPSEALVEAIVGHAIGRMEHMMDKLPATAKGRVIRADYEARQRNDKKEAALAKKHEEIVSDSGWAFNGKKFMSNAGAKHKSDREATAERIGINPINV